ncbi:XRE family transcriptional regulator [Dehalococcoides mccartyi]|jgi:addiction module HigA family antidote|uniref:HigA family addiction module antitoxin n=1 Tax=Dehalococcoides mccartyi TaxID=61435 RepID=UPI00071DCF91|nr:HigA family addiction module antitoxin [Dehalococcoides mccartyi]AQU05235.1 addiction module antidote protein, HigA family [Dehalococcoides mccartyi]AQU06687.1 addiction module antidote protein, HigA family [Dehalococcoides mccartyi]AQX74045.1 addiction module antidote protein, HigA family [Dehalococcoides mccartyi]AQY72558.1 addiction module antidote protein, HigA family [Dehalococcoides mccartyi]KSV17343.1 XRE family transcriptional regulator [Dehalococcoides mccartyi]
MSNTKLYRYEPDYVAVPGEILEENLEAQNIKKVDLASRCGLSTKTISQIINGTASISPETALGFQKVLGVSANIWLNLEADYRLFLAQQDLYKRLSKSGAWLNKFPIKELINKGFIEAKESIAEKTDQLLVFFGVSDIESWELSYNKLEVAFRHSPSFKSLPEAIATWLRIGEICAAKVKCKPFDKSQFSEALNAIRILTPEEPKIFEPRLKEMCAEAGVALVFLEELPGMHLSGATRWITKDKALIMLSLRHKSDDHFWFSFFHEAGHILSGGKKSIFLDESNSWEDPEEDQANNFASDLLIPKQEYESFLKDGKFTSSSVTCFAQNLGIAPGIVVGRLQHEQVIGWNSLYRLKRRFRLVEVCS